jgi:hypothetical protein
MTTQGSTHIVKLHGLEPPRDGRLVGLKPLPRHLQLAREGPAETNKAKVSLGQEAVMGVWGAMCDSRPPAARAGRACNQKKHKGFCNNHRWPSSHGLLIHHGLCFHRKQLRAFGHPGILTGPARGAHGSQCLVAARCKTSLGSLRAFWMAPFAC